MATPVTTNNGQDLVVGKKQKGNGSAGGRKASGGGGDKYGGNGVPWDDGSGYGALGVPLPGAKAAAERAAHPRWHPDGGAGSHGSGNGSQHHQSSNGGGGGNGGDLMSLVHQAGFKGQAAQTMYAIVMAESGGNRFAHNTNSSTGDNSYGLAQINMLGSMGPERLRQYGLSSNSDLFDPLTNLKVAYALSNHGTNFSPWTTYTSGSYQQFMGQSGAQVSGHGGPGGSGGGGYGGHLTAQQYRDQLGAVGDLINSVPEFKHLVDQAVAGGWTTDRLTNAIENTDWYRHHSATARSWLAQQASDPASYREHLNNTVQSVQSLAEQNGWDLTAEQAQQIARSAMMTGNDSNQTWIAHHIGGIQGYMQNPDSLSSLHGGMAATVQQLQQMASDYGYNYGNPGQLEFQANQILQGRQTIDTYRQQMENYAISAFPGLADQIKSGQTVSQIANPYVQSMSNLLEIDPSTLGVQTPLIRRALQGTQAVTAGKSTTPAVTPLWAFEDQVRQDPRWGLTDNAKQEAATMLTSLGQEWGFA